MLRAAIIGCGAIAQVHRAVLQHLPEATLVACADVKPERARAMAESCGGIRAYTSLEALLAGETVDVVHLCVPHPLHTPLACLAASRGVNVFTEKPPVVNRAQWTSFEALKKSGVAVGVCFQNRYNGAVQALRRLIADPSAGRTLGARAFVTWHREAPYYADSDWRGRWDTEGGGALINQSIHTLDLLTYLLGRAARVETTMRNHTLKGVIEVEDTVEACIDFESGARALFYATNGYAANAPVMVEVACENVRVRMEGDELTAFWADGAVKRQCFNDAEALGKDYWGAGHHACIRDFYQSIEQKRPFANDIDSVKNTMDLMLAMYAPYTGKTIE